MASIFLYRLEKATLGYFEYSVTANTFDWVWGLALTAAQVHFSSDSFTAPIYVAADYYIGLYENNSMDLFPTFFTVDYGPYDKVSLCSFNSLPGLTHSSRRLRSSQVLIEHYLLLRRHFCCSADPHISMEL